MQSSRTAALGWLVLLMIAHPRVTAAQEANPLGDALWLLDTWVATTVAQRGRPGLSLGVVLGDRVILSKGYGYADVARKVPASPQTLYRVASITKTFTAVAILQLRDAGKLQLDDPIRRHLSDVRIRAHTADASDITIRELLTHSSGLLRDVPGTMWSEPVFPAPAALKEELGQTYSSEVAWKYSNTGFALLGEIVSVVSGEPWERYVQRHILDPLGMASTRPMPRADEPGLAVGYGRSAPGGALVKAPAFGDAGAIRSAANLASNVDDLAKYLVFHMASDTSESSAVLSGRTRRDMQRPHWLLADWQNAWGLGFRVRRVGDCVQVSHSGSVPGYRTQVEFVPALRLGVVVLTNAEEGDPASYIDYALRLLCPLVAKAATHRVPVLQASAASYVGRYRSGNGLNTALVAILDGQLSLVAPDAANPYTWRVILEPTQDPRVFVVRSSGAFTYDLVGENLMFEVGADGRVSGYHTPIGGLRASTGVRSRSAGLHMPGTILRSRTAPPSSAARAA